MTVRIALFANHDSAQIAEIAEQVTELGSRAGFARHPDWPRRQTDGDDRPSRAPRWGNVDFTDIAAIHIRCTAPRTLPVLPPVLNEASYTDYRHGYINEQALNAATYGFSSICT